jgi:hypothetical protein
MVYFQCDYSLTSILMNKIKPTKGVGYILLYAWPMLPPWQREKREERKTSVSRGDQRELSVYSIHPQSDAYMTKVWKYRSTPSFRE